eukprot:6502862-Prymnesium_polylepis.1
MNDESIDVLVLAPSNGEMRVESAVRVAHGTQHTLKPASALAPPVSVSDSPVRPLRCLRAAPLHVGSVTCQTLR